MNASYKTIIDAGIIEAASLSAFINSKAVDIKIIDASFYLPGAGQDPYQNYLNAHIEGAQYFDIEGISDQNTDLPHMLPTAEGFEKAVSALGISNQDLIVIYGQSGMIMGPARAWWTFRAFGHDRVCVLNGGLPAWKAQGHPTSSNAVLPSTNGAFKAKFRPDLVKNLEQVLEASTARQTQIFDARPAGRFAGTEPEPRAGLRSGHIPNSYNLPCSALVQPDNGCFKAQEDIRKLFYNNGLQDDALIITSCGSGITACALALALHHIGLKDAAVYDGSWSEWGQDQADTPIETSQ